jgi:hypothetical protein
MSHIKLDIPDLKINLLENPDIRVILREPNLIVNQSDIQFFELVASAISASYALTSSFALNALTASFVDNIQQLGAIDNVFYVSENGDDGSDGKTLFTSFRTIAAATIAASQYLTENVGKRVSIEVKSGFYTETAPITVPPNVSILGDDLRTTVVRPTPATRGENLFLLNNACYIANLRLEGCEIDNLEDPRKGFFFAFAPNAFIITSPYIQNCTAVHTPPSAFYAPLDFENENPLIGNGPGGMLIDDSVLNGYSPLKSMVCDAYTQVAFNGIGVCVRGRGYAQLVSVFTNFSRTGIYAIDGGHVSLLNSNTTFGDYGLRSKGKRILVVPGVVGISTYTNNTDSTTIRSNKSNIVNHMITELAINGNYSSSYANPQSPTRLSTIFDAGLLVDAVADDLRSKGPARISQFTQGLFKGQDVSQNSIFTLPPATGFDQGAITVFPVNDGLLLAQDFILSYEIIRDYIVNDPDNLFTSLTSDTKNKVTELLNVPIETLTSVVLNNESTYLEEFGSLITSTAHDFSYAGSGVNFLGLPNNQGGIGKTNFDIRIVEEIGGRVFYTAGDESGDFFVGNDFVIKQQTGIIRGRTFDRAIAARFTPINLALENY